MLTMRDEGLTDKSCGNYCRNRPDDYDHGQHSAVLVIMLILHILSRIAIEYTHIRKTAASNCSSIRAVSEQFRHGLQDHQNAFIAMSPKEQSKESELRLKSLNTVCNPYQEILATRKMIHKSAISQNNNNPM